MEAVEGPKAIAPRYRLRHALNLAALIATATTGAVLWLGWRELPSNTNDAVSKALLVFLLVLIVLNWVSAIQTNAETEARDSRHQGDMNGLQATAAAYHAAMLQSNDALHAFVADAVARGALLPHALQEQVARADESKGVASSLHDSIFRMLGYPVPLVDDVPNFAQQPPVARPESQAISAIKQAVAAREQKSET